MDGAARIREELTQHYLGFLQDEIVLVDELDIDRVPAGDQCDRSSPGVVWGYINQALTRRRIGRIIAPST